MTLQSERYLPGMIARYWILIPVFFISFSIKAEELNFAREVLPILSHKCFVCHGPDAKKDELRLDSFAAATVDLGGYRAINPDSPGDSEIISRIHEKGDPMPPKKAEKKLTEKEREILTRWAKSGGKYTKHWAYAPPQRIAGSIDKFVRAKLVEAGGDFAPLAERATLARRAALVLTGLPPEKNQLDAFLKNSSPDAYEKLVDQLLTSSRFGEHQARYWLDAVRYGDTHGLHLDNRRGIFPYRDWVVRALNRDLPFDDFITWQLAGDLLENPTIEQMVATGYVRMNPTTAEGGAIPAEFQAKNNFDRTENFGTVFLGMTLNCARCHTHKYDPVTHQEYYKLFAFFNSTAESPMDGNAYIYPPVMKVPGSPSGWDEWPKLEQERDRLVEQLDSLVEKSKLEEKLLSYAGETLDWKSGDWKISTKDVPVEFTKPAESEKWKNLANQGGIRKERFPGNDRAKWIRFTISAPSPLTLIYKTDAGPDSDLVASGNSTSNYQNHTRLVIGKGDTYFTAKLQGIDRRTRVGIELINPWESLAKEKQWSSADAITKLILASDSHAAIFPEKIRKQAATLSNRLLKAKSEFVTTLVARDLPTPRETKLLERGEYNMPVGEKLEPDVFAVLNPFPEGAPRNRLGLARWLTAPENPLVTRVLVNRVWQSIFGEGIVRSPEDFGLQGRHPTHPELLDWLAIDFQENGWNYKSLIKKMVMSQTFRQKSNWRNDLSDSENMLFSRGPSFRLDAESDSRHGSSCQWIAS